jgi:hypothetical protein
MPQTIITRFLGPTNHRGSRIKATAWRASVTVPYNHALGGERAHRAAAEALCVKLTATDGGRGSWLITAGADLPAGNGYAFIIEWVPA